MSLNGFTKKDFELMELPGLENRMNAIKEQIQPKFKGLADQLVPFLNKQTNAFFYTHIARHARRTVNPPDSTWFALAEDKRGYKKYPHFQFGIWQSHLFFWLACIDDYPDRKELGESLLSRIPEIMDNTPRYFCWSMDHTDSAYVIHEKISADQLTKMFNRLSKVRKAELLCGVVISKEDPRARNGKQLADYLKDQANKLLPLYQLAKHCAHTSVSSS
ncbi:YktB family protein [Sporolactobacillus kofuensis]|uniref:UPF0637 protein ACFP7A_03240 n=1 Tax=Sporolactobacillus kofuensis TaxID=269672 RepID=A0ABW1WDH6_9BACL|nr:DUF1054 domain-containing protein [Sporolactobacillus kofuensis]MCO7174583.1 DUF1054 domain-containing protein [Sporolactobacillus kofuensis]